MCLNLRSGPVNQFLATEKSGGILRKLIRLVVLAVLFAASVISHPAVAKADEVMRPPRPFPKQLSVVQLGDSFSTGNGAGSYYGARGANAAPRTGGNDSWNRRTLSVSM